MKTASTKYKNEEDLQKKIKKMKTTSKIKSTLIGCDIIENEPSLLTAVRPNMQRSAKPRVPNTKAKKEKKATISCVCLPSKTRDGYITALVEQKITIIKL
jgi:hypothetical protein